MSFSSDLMDIALTESFGYESVNEGAISKFIRNLFKNSKRNKAKATSTESDAYAKKYEAAINKFKEDFKITQDVLNYVNIFSIVKTKEDFNKVIKATGSVNNSDATEMIFLTYCYVYDVPDDLTHMKELIEKVKEDIKNGSSYYPGYSKDALEVLQLADKKKLVPLSFDTTSTYYCPSNKKVYSVDYKGRITIYDSAYEYLDD